MICYALLLVCLTNLFLTEGRSHGQGRIVNGGEAYPHSFPWQVSVEKNGKHICGGSLILPTWVITAAHCVHKEIVPDPEQYQVVVGLHERDDDSYDQRYKVKTIIKHENYLHVLTRNDIALLKLTRAVVLSNDVDLVQMPSPNSRDPRTGTLCTVTGWGATGSGHALPNALQVTRLPIADHSLCQRKNSQIYPVKEESMICAGGVGTGGCQGDSGGPLVCLENQQYVLRGLVSWGDGECRTKFFTVFTRVSHYLPWIKKKIQNEDASSESCAIGA